MADPGSPYASPRRLGLQNRQQQRHAAEAEAHSGNPQKRRSRGAYMTLEETNIVMAILQSPSADDPNNSSTTTATTTPAALPPPGSPPRSEIFASRASAKQSPQSTHGGRAVIGNMLDQSVRRSISSVVDTRSVREPTEIVNAFLDDLPTLNDVRSSQRKEQQQPLVAGYGACNATSDEATNGIEEGDTMFQHFKRKSSREKCAKTNTGATCSSKQAPLIAQVPAIAVVSLLNLMMAIPFGVSYFPIGWSGASESTDTTAATPGGGEETDGVSGPFPLPNKEALGIRMCLFSTLIGQIVMTFASKFDSAIAFQMIENLPFFHQLAFISIANQGYGKESLSTLFFLFGLSTLMVGVVFYLLGALDLGRVCYFFPTHVLVGCIGGIGVFIIISSIEVTNNVTFTWDLNGIHAIIDNIHLFGVVLLFEITLRILTWRTKGGIPLLAPIYFCSIPFIFYGFLWLLRIDTDVATEAGYFFDSPPQEDSSSTTQSLMGRVFDVHTFDLLHVVDFRTISWSAVYQSLGTMIALSAFSLIHVPVNIPAFSISMDLDTDMNAELVAHGYSNAVAGLFAGLPNYMTYSNSLLYAKSKGGGRVSSLLVAFFTFVFFLFGPEIAAFIPRCMAGTLLLHIGLDLFLEGVVDSYGSYDRLEYGGIWFIVITMTAKGMSGGLIAGVFAALSVYAAQSITYMNPIREIMPATTLRSSVWTRPAAELAILNDDLVGRAKILLVQLQGHLFFGNVTQLTDPVKKLLSERKGTDLEPLIVILDFTLVLGLDSSAAHAVAKMNNTMHSRFNVAATIFVAGRDGFPCEFALSEALSKHPGEDNEDEEFERLADSLASIGQRKFRRNRVCDNLDDALIFAEDCLIARQDPTLLKRDLERVSEPSGFMTPDEERRLAAQQLAFLFPRSDKVTNAATLLFSFFEREEYTANQIIWKQGSDSDCAKLLVRGELIAYTENSANTSMAAERVPVGNLVGELGMVHGLHRLSTLECTSEKAVLYSLSLDNWKKIRKEHTFAALYFEEIVIRYLAQRVQHVTNRVVESRCLPV